MKNFVKNGFIVVFLFLLYAFPASGANGEKKPGANHLKGGQKADIILVLDNSGSMKKNDPDFLTRDVVTNFLSDFGDKARFGMVIFDKEAVLAEPLAELTDFETKTRFMTSMEKVDYSGQYTNTPDGIERAIYELKVNGHPDALKFIIFLTDGIVITEDKAKDQERETWLKEVLTEECRKIGIRIFGIAFTEKADFSLIQTLAVKTNGDYFRAYKVEDIQTVFNKIMTVITSSAEKAKQEAKTEMSEKQEAEEGKGPQDKGTSFVFLFGFVIIIVLLAIVVFVLLRNSSILKIGKLSGFGGRASREMLSGPRAELKDVRSLVSSDNIILGKPIMKIGRAENNDIVIPVKTVSGSHAIIEYKKGLFYLEDLNSSNKTFLNGQEIKPGIPNLLKNNDLIEFHTCKFTFILSQAAVADETIMDFGAQDATEETMTTVDFNAETTVKMRVDDSQAMPQAMLVDVKNATSQKTIMLEKIITRVGRGPSNDVVIAKDSVSGSHAFIEYKDGFFYIEDQRSSNKTFLNDEELPPYESQKLKSGDEISFHIYPFMFLLEDQFPTGDTSEWS